MGTPVRLSCRQVKISLKEANSKEEWQPKKFSALSSSLPLRLLQHPNAMTRKQQPTRRPTQQQRSTQRIQPTRQQSTQQQRRTQRTRQQSTQQQRSTHCIQRLQRIQEDIISHFANASTPSLDIPMHTGETQ